MVAACGAAALLVAVGADADYATDCVNPTATFTEADIPAALNLGPTDVVIFESGTFTGPVETNAATICVAGPAVFAPSSINGGAELFVRGTVVLPALAANSGSVLDNEGMVTLLAQPNVNGLATVINRAGATLIVDSPLSLGAGVTASNDGTIEINGDVNFGGTFTNRGTMVVHGVLNLNGSITNETEMTVDGLTTVNGGGSLTNLCRYTSDGLISNAIVTNAGIIDLGAGDLLNNGAATFTQSSTGLVEGVAFTNSGSVVGAGQYLFTGTTQNLGSVVGDSAADPIVFFDTSQTTGGIFDVQTGVVTNVVRQPVEAPPPGVCTTSPTTTTSTSTTSTSTTSTTSTTTTSTSTTSTSTTSTSTTSTSTTSTSTTSTSTTSTSTTSTTTPTSTTSTTEAPPESTTSTPTGGDGSSTTVPGGGGASPAQGGPDDPGSSSSERTLPWTGSGGTPGLVAIAACLLVLGAALGTVARRRSG